MLQVKRLHPDAILPVRAHDTDAGLDLFALEDAVIYPGETVKVKTGIGLAIPNGKVGLIWPRSSMGSKGLDIMAGVIDSSYRGEVLVCLYNSNPGMVPYDHDNITGIRDITYDNVYHISKGDKIAQLLIQDVSLCEVVEVENLDDTDRGSNGFGSSGV